MIKIIKLISNQIDFLENRSQMAIKVKSFDFLETGNN